MPEVAVEQWLADPIPLEGVILGTPPPREAATATVSCTVKDWQQIAKWMQVPMLYSLTSAYPSISSNDASITGGCFKKTKFDIKCWGGLYLHGKFRTLQQMFTKVSPSSMDTTLYVRLRQSIKEYTPSYPQEPQPLTPLHRILQSETATHVVSTLYHSIYFNRALGRCTAKGKWEADIGQEIRQAVDLLLYTDRTSIV